MSSTQPEPARSIIAAFIATSHACSIQTLRQDEILAHWGFTSCIKKSYKEIRQLLGNTWY